MTSQPSPEFSRPLPPERLGGAPLEMRITADEAERAALAKRFGLLALPRLEARVKVSVTGPGPRVHLEGHLEAEVVQACVVTLEPVRSTIGQDFVQAYLLAEPGGPRAGVAREVAVGPGPEDEDPEPLGPAGLDLGEAVAQELALALDPYPHAPGARVPESLRPDGGGAGAHRPFEALRTLKPR